jgi:hypothetical protein
MIRIIHLNESDLLKLVNNVISESADVKYGCDFLPNGVTKRFCKSIECDLKNNRTYINFIQEKINEYSSGYLKNYSGNIRSLEYNKTVDFFKERRTNVILALEIFKSCNEIRNLITNKMVEFVKKYVIVDENTNYSQLNKLGTNYSALSYMITEAGFKKYHDKSTDVIVKDFFNSLDNNGNTPFMILMESFKNDNPTLNNIIKTINQTTNIGKNTENEVKLYLKKEYPNAELIDFTGDYSFIDMIGIDFAINLNGNWIPIQIKTNKKSCRSLYGVKNCENWCIGKENRNFKIERYS